MDKVYEAGIFSSTLMEEIRSQFAYVDWDPYSGERICGVSTLSFGR